MLPLFSYIRYATNIAPTIPAATTILNRNQRKPPPPDEDLVFLPGWGYEIKG
jgi:hypothetical protein